MEGNKRKLITAPRTLVDDDQNTMNAGRRGPPLMQDVHLMAPDLPDEKNASRRMRPRLAA